MFEYLRMSVTLFFACSQTERDFLLCCVMRGLHVSCTKPRQRPTTLCRTCLAFIHSTSALCVHSALSTAPCMESPHHPATRPRIRGCCMYAKSLFLHPSHTHLCLYSVFSSVTAVIGSHPITGGMHSCYWFS